MHITVEPRDDYAILYARGEFDTYYVPLLQQEIEGVTKAGMLRVVLNLHLVKFINSTALGAIIKASKTLSARGGKMVISRPSVFCKDIMSKVGLDRVVSVYDSDEEAAEALSSPGVKTDAKTEEPAGSHGSTVLFSPIDSTRLEDFLPEDQRTLKTRHGSELTQAGWSGAGRMLALDLTGLAFTWNGGTTALSPTVMAQFLELGSIWRVKFRLPLLRKGYCEAQCSVTSVEVRPAGIKVRATFGQIDADTKSAIKQYASDLAYLKDELRRATDG